MYLFKFIFMSFYLFFWSCTSNPLWESEPTKERKLTGEIGFLSENLEIPLIIWDENFKILGETDRVGNFSILLKDLSSGIDKISGSIKIYFFALNFALDSAQVFLINGDFSNNQTDFNQNGELVKNIQLKKILEGQIFLPLEDTFSMQNDTLLIRFQMKALSKIVVKTYKYMDGVFECNSGLIFKNIENNDIKIYNHVGVDSHGLIIQDQIKYVEYDMNETSIWRYYVDKNSLSFEPGSYVVIPYLTIEQFNLVDPTYSFDLSNEFLNIPSDFLLDTLKVR